MAAIALNPASALNPAIALDIDYQFDCRRVTILEKIYKEKNFGIAPIYFWGFLSRTISPEYIKRHPEKPWDQNDIDWSIFFDKIKPGTHETLAEMEEKIRKIKELDKVPICDCNECYNEDDIPILHRKQWYNFSANPNLSLEIIEKHWNKDWNVYCLAKNSMTGAKTQFKKEYLAALKIQEAFLRAKFNPAYAYCRRLHTEFYQSLL